MSNQEIESYTLHILNDDAGNPVRLAVLCAAKDHEPVYAEFDANDPRWCQVLNHSMGIWALAAKKEQDDAR